MKPTKPYVIGIIGGSGTGKTFFANYMTTYVKALFIEGDQVGRQAIKRPEVIKAIGQAYTLEVIDEEGQVNRQALGSIVFRDKSALIKLNQIIHPVMYQLIEEDIQQCDLPVVILEAAVMIEAGFNKLVDEMWYIKADDEVRLKRLTELRGIDVEKAKGMMASGRDDFRSYSDVIIDATWGLEPIKDEINRLLDRIVENNNEKSN